MRTATKKYPICPCLLLPCVKLVITIRLCPSLCLGKAGTRTCAFFKRFKRIEWVHFFFFFLCSKGYAHPGRLSVFKSLLLFILQLPNSTVYNLRPYFQSWLAHAAWLITSSRDYSVRWPRGYTTCNFIIKTQYRNILYLKFPHPPPPKCKFMK